MHARRKQGNDKRQKKQGGNPGAKIDKKGCNTHSYSSYDLTSHNIPFATLEIASIDESASMGFEC